MKIEDITVPEYPGIRMLTVDGLTAAQSSKVTLLLEEMKNEKHELLIEIGTCRGGFSLLLRHYFPDAEIYTI